MARIQPRHDYEQALPVKAAFERHILEYNGRITNMKTTLGHSLPAFEAYMHWYPLYREVEKITGARLAYLYAYTISNASDCPICSTFFRKMMVDAGENPDNLELTAPEKCLVDLGRSIARYQGNIANHIYDCVAKQYSASQMVVLIAFAGQMIATNIFNNVIETEIDEYLRDYTPKQPFPCSQYA